MVGNNSTNLTFKYGAGEIGAVLHGGRFLAELAPKGFPGVADLEAEIIRQLEYPVASEPLKILARQARKIAIVTSDHTRVLPSEKILPVIFNYLEQKGVTPDKITIVIGGGNHRSVTAEEKVKLLGTLNGKVRSCHSRETGYKLLGLTTRGTPVEVSVPVAEADLVIALGNIEFHQLAGFSGGVKAVAAGAASSRALEYNHRLNILQGNKLGELEENQVRQDMEEFARTAGLRFIVNTVLNYDHQVISVVAGDPIEAHRIGCETARESFAVEIDEKADIVIVSPGGSPKDDTVYQSQKTLLNALRAVVQGGIIIFAAKCGEGFGDPVFERWMSGFSNVNEIEERTASEFVLGGHKCTFIAKAVKHATIFMVSDMESTQVKKLFFEPYNYLQEAINAALHIKGDKASILVMPWGGVTVPFLRQSKGN